MSRSLVGRKGVGHDICARLYFNNTYRRSGTPWVGRYSATVVDRERYRLDVIRYLALNPAREGKVEELKIGPGKRSRSSRKR